MNELITVGEQIAKQSAGAVNLLKKLHETLEKSSPEERASLYNRAKTAKKVFTDLCEAVEAWALNTKGEIKGYKVGPGNGQRAWGEEASKIALDLTEQFDVTMDDLYELKSPAEIEKILGNKLAAKQAVALYTKVGEGKLGLRSEK